MVREIINKTDASITLCLPEDLVGKRVEVIAFEIEGNDNSPTKTERLDQIIKITKPTLTDLSGFKFDRNEANNYNE